MNMGRGSKTKQSRLRNIRFGPGATRILVNSWPPFLGAGIHIEHIADDWRHIRVRMRQHFFNSSFFGTHLGGSLYAMCDPFYALMLIRILGPDYVVWDRAAHVDFKLPARGCVRADFSLDTAQIDEVIAATANGEKFEPVYSVAVLNEKGEEIASIVKTLYVRRHIEKGKTS